MKKFISILLVCTLLLVGCDSIDANSNTNTSANVTDTNDSTDTSTTDTKDDTGDTQMILNLPTQDQMDLKADKTDISSPYKFKGSCTYANLPSSGNVVNDTYYVTDQKCKYTWNGRNWYQSSLNESDYEDEFNEFKTELTQTVNTELSDVKAELAYVDNCLSFYSKSKIELTRNNFANSHYSFEQGYINSYGVLISSDYHWRVSEFINVIPNSEIEYSNLAPVNGVSFITFYDSNKDRIIGVADLFNGFVIVPVNAVYARFTFSVASDTEQNYYFNSYVNDIGKEYEEFRDELTSCVGEVIISKNDILSKKVFSINGYIDPQRKEYHYDGNWVITDFIEIIPNTLLSYNNIITIPELVTFAFYDADKTYIIGLTSTENKIQSGSILVPENTKYIKLAFRTTISTDPEQVFKFRSYTSITNIVASMQKDKNNGGQWKDKVWHCFGTSLTDIRFQGKYSNYLAEMSGLIQVNHGISGGQIQDEIIEAIMSDTDIANADLITVEGFVNDFRYSIPLGNITDTNLSDGMYGAMYTVITYILEHSNATLVFITDNTGTNYGEHDLRRNVTASNGLTQRDYNEATIKMCNYMGIPVIDAGGKCGISEETAELYLEDQIHHSELGGKQFAQTIWDELKNISPRVIN